ncbi:Fe-S cluster assembly protein SufD [Breoghania sp. L-A4]|uniref:Fe-S cluster assembly protein SufD n=1 Tax=Breoghania sp. L-A4 TaxID=2304600 RepID=UPI000E35B91E|nr:Fe-S cluster assembly protein SufD [Breoghania sp. L-A4]AXS40516.1 Fe-S cluster assembly protein SufD [Breoghania sp. L-A4]
MTSNPQVLRTAAEQGLIDQYGSAKGALPGGDAVAAIREKAFRGFEAKGLPHRRVEAWKYTDLRREIREALPLSEAADPEQAKRALANVKDFGAAAGYRVVFVNGLFCADLSDLDGLVGVSISSLESGLMNGRPDGLGELAANVDDPAVGLNTAFMRDGALIRVADGVTVDKAIELLHVTTGPAAVAYMRHVVHVGEGAKVRFLDAYEGFECSGYQTNVAVELYAANGADIGWVKLQEEARDALHISSFLTLLGEKVTFNQFTFTSGGRVSRGQAFVTFAGEHSTVGLRGTTLINGDQHADITLVIDHAVPNCDSREYFKAVIDGHAKGVFQGRINVHPHAQKTDGQMMTQSLLLSDDAEMAYKPELEIFADDVQCAHGATSGQIDEDLLFYLRARGIPEAEARTMLVLAFLAEAIEEIGEDDIVANLEERARAWLAC